eukprot:GHVU01215246.1.p1 GENE.GHVU01215246.1~~GHVU01215246.1.p1  ORF type:complete len:561 (-),score=93.94 GHVU01215246.1:141-1823(-)
MGKGKSKECPFRVGTILQGRRGDINFVLQQPAEGRANELDAEAKATSGVYSPNGDGELVICMHGLNASMSQFDQFADKLVERNYRVLRFDFYGHGLSSVPKDADRYDPQLFISEAEDVLAHLGLSEERFHSVGFSMGGMMAAYLADANSARVLSLTCLAPAGLLRHKPMPARLLHNECCGKMCGGCIPCCAGGCPCCVTSKSFGDMFVTRQDEEVQRVKDRLTYDFRRTLDTLVKCVRGMPLWQTPDPWMRVLRDRVPVLLAWGWEDQIVPLQEVLPELQRIVRESVRVSLHRLKEGDVGAIGPQYLPSRVTPFDLWTGPAPGPRNPRMKPDHDPSKETSKKGEPGENADAIQWPASPYAPERELLQHIVHRLMGGVEEEVIVLRRLVSVAVPADMPVDVEADVSLAIAEAADGDGDGDGRDKAAAGEASEQENERPKQEDVEAGDGAAGGEENSGNKEGMTDEQMKKKESGSVEKHLLPSTVDAQPGEHIPPYPRAVSPTCMELTPAMRFSLFTCCRHHALVDAFDAVAVDVLEHLGLASITRKEVGSAPPISEAMPGL